MESQMKAILMEEVTKLEPQVSEKIVNYGKLERLEKGEKLPILVVLNLKIPATPGLIFLGQEVGSTVQK